MHNITPGTQLTISYPRNRHILYIDRAATVERNITVRQIRDLVTDPLTPEEFFRRPYLARSRWLVRAVETLPNLATQYRQFYLGNSIQFARPGVLRLAWYSPEKQRPLRIIARQFQPTPRDRKLMVRMIRRLPPIDDLQLRILADDFNLIA